MHALGHDEHPDVANYIGYAYRKLGDYENSKIWYEAALTADPTTCAPGPITACGRWSRATASRRSTTSHKVKSICGNTTCQAFVQLKAVIDGTASY